MMKKIKKILITGSSGTIGTRLFEMLLAKGYDVAGFDRVKNTWHKNLDAKTIQGDLLNKNDIKKLPKDIDLVVHFAANARVYDLVQDPDMALENIVSTYNILEFCRKNTIKNIIFSGSREVYGNKKNITSKEEDVDITFCESPYAASKIADEVLVYSYAKCYGINYVVCRFSNVYGMYDKSDRFIPLLIRNMKRNETINIFGKDKVLDFTYIDDCIGGVIKCIEKFNAVKNTTLNIASGHGENLVEVANMIKQGLQSKSKIILGDNRQGEVVKFIADISKARKLLVWEPKILIEEGVALSINWYKKNNGF